MANSPSKPSVSAKSRAAAAQAQRKKNNTTMYLVIGVVMVIGVALIVAIASGGKDTTKKATAGETVTILDKVTSVPAATYDAVGLGSVTAKPQPASGQALTKDGKPEILYIGAEFCPYCAAERWGLATALARFGTFTNVGVTHSSGTDVFPNTATLTFHGSTYTSTYLAFTPIEAQTTDQKPLDPVTDEQQKIWAALDPNQSYPFIDFAGKFVISGASYDPGTLQGKTASEIADALADPTSTVAKGAIGTANAMTAAICKLTKDQPAAVCSSKAVTALA